MLLALLPLMLLGYFSYRHMESGLMPKVDEGGFILDYVAPPGTSLTETDRILRQVEQILRHTPEVQTYSRRTGYAMGGDFSEPNTGDFFVRLKPLPRRDIEEVMADVRKQVKEKLPQLDTEFSQLMEDIIGDITGRPEPIVVNLFSDDEELLLSLSEKVKDAIAKVDGVADPANSARPAGDALNIEVDRIKASLEGVDPETISKAMENALSGSVATQIQVGPKLVDVRVWLPPSVRQTTHDVSELPLRAPDGHVFPLK